MQIKSYQYNGFHKYACIFLSLKYVWLAKIYIVFYVYVVVIIIEYFSMDKKWFGEYYQLKKKQNFHQ